MAEMEEKMLEYDETHSKMGNFYYHLFGERLNNGRDEDSYTVEEEKLLVNLIWMVAFSGAICEFYGFGMNRRLEEIKTSQVVQALERVRESRIKDAISAVYNDLSSLRAPYNCDLDVMYYSGFSDDLMSAMAARIKYLEQENATLRAKAKMSEDDLR